MNLRTSCLIVSFGLAGLSAGAEEPVVRGGLALYLDAAAQPTARQATALPPIGNRQPLDLWLDAGPAGREASQPVAERRPEFITDGSAAFVRFDGKDDFLAVQGARQLSASMTVFVLAAPRENPGMFSALLSTAETGRNDYTSGLNVDFGPAATKELSVVNVEGAGAAGARDLLVPGVLNAAERPFGGFHVFTVRSRIATEGLEFFLDGLKGGERPRLESNAGLDRITIGARMYSNDPAQPPFAQGYFGGDIAAVLVYDRALSEAERALVEQSLFVRTPALNALAAGKHGHALEPLSDPPVVQMLVPGFTVHELPLQLTNVTNLRYRHDGKLVALGYDGRLHLLTDTDGDGLEDEAEIFWDKAPLRAPIGLGLLPKNDPRGEGAFVASKARVSLLLDANRDGRADEEIVAATGWNETFHGVDTLGLAVDPKDGAIYFSIGCANFTDGYLRDPATGRSNYRLDSPRGTIQRLSSDFKTRETVCTGVRFACALAFNRFGDLFATEQEGATWLPNGNPLDELLHIVPGRHYGFPPRHPRHLPDVVDEPAIMEYGPQHQSTVGMVFNEGVNGGPAFGPASWHGDAMICGESRGKLYRTKLVKTPQGYVARNHLIACLGLLTVDACVSPQGDLLIACHSGPPDWGTGPAGEGRIFKVRHAHKETPQPVFAWAAAPDEFRIAFDRPLQPGEWAGAKNRVRIEAGRHVSAGDRYEVIRPGYQAVRDQMAAPRRWVEAHSLSLSADQRTLVLRVPRQTDDVTYAVTLPVPPNWQPGGGIAQHAEMDVAVSLHGMQATFGDHRVVLPHPSLAVSGTLTQGSADHAAFLSAVTGNGTEGLLVGGINASNLFVPAIQPGASLDWDIARDAFANRSMMVREDFTTGVLRDLPGSAQGPIQHLQLALQSGFHGSGSGLVLALDDRVRPVPLHRLLLPWAAAASEQPPAAGPLARTDVNGRWLHGRRLFFGETACFTCHTIRGEGMPLGPDLTNLVFRDRDSVLQDILQPSATLNPDHPGSTVTFTDGTSLTGLIETLNAERAVIRLAAGAVLDRPRQEVAGVAPMSTSLMPEGYRERLSAEAVEDLLTFLLTNPLEPAPITRLDPPTPPARTRAEIAGFSAPPSAAPPPPLRLLLSGGVKDHGTDEHDYPLWLDRWSRLLALADQVTVAACNGFPSQAQLESADVAVFYSNNAGWNLASAALLDRHQQRGGGLVYLHWGIEGHMDAGALAERAGLAFSFSSFRHGEMDLRFSNSDHPITKGFNRLRLVDESYWKLRGDPSRLAILATSAEDQQPQPQLWTLQRGQARVFGCIPGHFTWTFDDPLYRLLVLRGIAWAAHQNDVNRFAELMTVGARIAP